MQGIFKSKVKSQKSKSLAAQKLPQFRNYKETPSHAAKLYLRYCGRVMEVVDAVVLNNGYSPVSCAERQVAVVRSF